jgi:hypothetical protein
VKLLTGNMCRFAVLVVILLLFFLSATNHSIEAAEPNDNSAGVKAQQKSSGSYCGIYCLYAAMKFFGVSVDPNELIKSEFIGSAKGSSLAELKKCAENHGLYAVPVDRVTTKDLRDLSCPAIIHVKSSPTRKSYDHYNLFLGTKKGQVLIYDPPGPIEMVESWTLAPRWDGSGLLVSDKPINPNSVFATSRLRFASYAGIAAVIVLAVRYGRRHLFGLRKTTSKKQMLLLSFGQCAVLVIAAVLGALAYHSINDEGLLLRRKATETIQQAHKASLTHKAGDKEKLTSRQ